MVGWINHPAMRHSDVAVAAVFSALVVGSDYALTPFVNFKLMDTIVFIVAFVFGFRQGAAVAVISETIWSVISPWGQAGVIAPFLVAGEIMFAVAGWGASKMWGAEKEAISPISLFMGATMTICAFLWDLETNAATALIAYWPTLNLGLLIATELRGFVFGIPMIHEVGDFLLGAMVAPAAIMVIPKVGRRV
jgi:uncharacterized membrane protein